MIRVAILNVKYSPNLGDGIIAECLESELSKTGHGLTVRSVDLAGREDFGTGLDAGRDFVLRIVDMLPQILRPIVLRLALTAIARFWYRPAWRRKLAGSDWVLIGGGQLIADTDLNFPIKLNAALGEVACLRKPVAVFGVGVAHGLSRSARRLFTTALHDNRVVHVAVRDIASRKNWDSQLACENIPKAFLCRDPGLLAGEVYPGKSSSRSGERPHVGIGIVNPRTLSRHAADSVLIENAKLRDAWVELVRELLACGFEVSLFTNGPGDDEEFLDKVIGEIDDPRVHRSARPLIPGELAARIRSFDAIIAHRLHASILAYAYRIPHVACAWDPKVEAFFRSVGRGDFVVELGETGAEDICRLLAEAIEQGIDPAFHDQVVAETRAAVRKCAEKMGVSMGLLEYSADPKVQEFDQDATCPG